MTQVEYSLFMVVGCLFFLAVYAWAGLLVRLTRPYPRNPDGRSKLYKLGALLCAISFIARLILTWR
jgi:hypothetical protein